MVEQSRFCDQCGARLERSSSKFCASCGAEISAPSEQQRTEATNDDMLQTMRLQESRRQEEVWLGGSRFKNRGAVLKGCLGFFGLFFALVILVTVCTAVVM